MQAARKAALRYYVKSGATDGWVHPYFDYIAIVKWLNETFGYHLTVPELLADDSPWDDWQLDMHMIYSDTFNDEALLNRVREGKLRDRLARKGGFSVNYELSHPRR